MLIGIAGPARSGKDTVANYICSYYQGFVKLSFATPLKFMLEKGLGFTEEQLHGGDKEKIDPRFGKSPRYIMQTLGTEWGRDLIHPDIWVICLEAFLRKNTVIADVRFDNEANFIREKGGLLIHVERGRKGTDNLLKTLFKSLFGAVHTSEKLVTRLPGDAVIQNKGTTEELYKKVNLCLKVRGLC